MGPESEVLLDSFNLNETESEDFSVEKFNAHTRTELHT